MTAYGKADGLRFKAVLMKLPPNVAKSKVLRGLWWRTAAGTPRQMPVCSPI